LPRHLIIHIRSFVIIVDRDADENTWHARTWVAWVGAGELGILMREEAEQIRRREFDSEQTNERGVSCIGNGAEDGERRFMLAGFIMTEHAGAFANGACKLLA